MSLRDLSFKKAYNSDSDNILQDFYVPTLSEAVQYDRLSGFFSSTSLAVAARGIVGLIRTNGHMRMVVFPHLSRADLKAVHRLNEDFPNHVISVMLAELEKLEDDFVRDHVYALGWLLTRGKLDIRVALLGDLAGDNNTKNNMYNSGIFHQKVGILSDSEGNIVSFSGSVNETASGWMGNIEEFKVFRNWEPGESGYVQTDIVKFEKFWSNTAQGCSQMKLSDC